MTAPRGRAITASAPVDVLNGYGAPVQSVGGSSAKERGLPAETYYLVFTGGGSGIYDLILEERP